MQQVPANLSQEDLHQWLHGCYFYVSRRPNEQLLCTLVGSAQPNVPHSAQSLATDEMIPITNPEYITCFWPPTGAVNLPHRQYSIFIERQPRKQWKRSFNPSCYSFRRVGVGSNGFDSGGEKGNISTIECVIAPKFYSFGEAKRMFDQGWSSVAITPQLTVVNGDIIKVYWQRDLIGKVLRDGSLYVHDESMYRYVSPHITE